MPLSCKPRLKQQTEVAELGEGFRVESLKFTGPNNFNTRVVTRHGKSLEMYLLFGYHLICCMKG